MAAKKVALLTSGGVAPCLSASIGRLIERYTDISPDTEMIAYTAVSEPPFRGILAFDYVARLPGPSGETRCHTQKFKTVQPYIGTGWIGKERLHRTAVPPGRKCVLPLSPNLHPPREKEA